MTLKKRKNGPQKLLIIGPDPFISRSSSDHSPLHRIDFSYYGTLGPDICSLICVARASALIQNFVNFIIQNNIKNNVDLFLGQCLCAPGFEGDDPYNTAIGCSAKSKCTYHTDCGYNEICTTLANTVHRQCVDACSRATCGPNAYCVTDNHHMTCICNEGFNGNPNNMQSGCQKESGCSSASDCAKGN